MTRARKWKALKWTTAFVGALPVMLGSIETAWADDAAAKKKTASLGLIRLEGAESCIATKELAVGVEKVLGRSVFVSAAEADLAIAVRFERGPAGFKAIAALQGPNGEPQGTRELTNASADCHALDDSLKLAIALMVDPDATLGPKPPPVPTATTTSSAPPPPPPPRTVYVEVPGPPAPKEPEDDPYLFDATGAASIAFGKLPSPSPGVVVDASLEPPWFVPFETRLAFYFPSSLEGPRGSTISFMTFLGGAYVCPISHREEIFQVRVCAGPEFGFVAEDPQGFDENYGGLSFVIDGSLRGRIDFHVVGPLVMGLAADFDVPFLTRTYVYEKSSRPGDTGFLFEASPVSGALDLFAGFAFP